MSVPNRFSYVLAKIKDAPFTNEPFKHIYIDDVLAPEDFSAVVDSDQIALSAESDKGVLSRLRQAGYKPISFPGCVTSESSYLSWLKDGGQRGKHHAATEGFGMVYRLMDYKSPVLKDLDEFFRSDALRDVLIEKFGLEGKVSTDAGLQKYLHGYEISPHPDVRKKALTWMLNINPGLDSEKEVFHTHYMTVKPEWRHVTEFWERRLDFDRDWIPWDWCETKKVQTKNNSIVFFAPSNDTLHAVRAAYDHKPRQRTQAYGNLWFADTDLPKMPFTCFDPVAQFKVHQELQSRSFSSKLNKSVSALKTRARAIVSNAGKRASGARHPTA